jgi:hypothetical protein
MRKAVSLVASLLLLVATVTTSRAVEKTIEYAVQASASVEESPAKITLHWPQDSCTEPQCYTIFRKTPGASSWGKPISLPGTASEYVDKNVASGTTYEYQIVKTTPNYTGYGYVCAGIKAPLNENRGRLLLVVDKTHAASLNEELERLRQDIVGDGWTVTRLDVAPTDSVVSVKALIKAQYAADPANVKAVFLFGHVPVPYSGDIVPDGHAPDHQGAWPCDGFYGDMDGVWTDRIVRDLKAADARNRNVPGDGKYDQSTFPAALKLMVGRVDLSKMPGRLTYGGPGTFPEELELLRNYLNKDHNFRHKQFDLPRRGVVGDYFGVRDGEAFAASGWRNLASFFDAAHVTTLSDEGTWISNLSSNSYLWAYGCGPGSFTSIGGLGKSDSFHDGVTTELYKNDPKAAFTMLFGSWLGDWDSEDNFQRAALALPSYGLTCVCSGRPHWFMHHMALGETIGYSTRLTQNNRPEGLYRNQQNNCAGQIHIALMGDPTLRMHTVGPAANLTCTNGNEGAMLNWDASSDSVLGYHIYRAKNPDGVFTRLTSTPIENTSYVDAAGSSGATYMVRAVKLETSASGTYYNASQGIFAWPAEPASIATAANSQTSTARKDSAVRSNDPQRTAPVTPTGTTNSAVRALSPTGATAITNNTAWVNDALPAGAVAGADGGDWWNWVSSNPKPLWGTLANQSSANAGLHQHYFTYATGTLAVNAGETMFAYVYLDPANVPSEIMLQWNNGSWEHRAYWGANRINYGADATAGRKYMGPLPPAGQWTRLEVPASQVALEGSTLTGMAFSQFDGRATWDYAGKAAVILTNIPTNQIAVSTNIVAWMDDALPAGAISGSDGGDAWTWTIANPAPFSGVVANQSSTAPGSHQHYFFSATQTLNVNTGDVLIAYAYLDPANVPSELMLQWNDGSWEHRAYWGANSIASGTDGTVSRRSMGALPATGQWVRLEVPASQVGLEGRTLNGMAFTLFDGRVTWDLAGKATALLTNIVPPATNPPSATSVSWVDDSVPAGGITGADGGDAWSWISSAPTPASGALANQSSIAAGLHQHYFTSATTQLGINTGDNLFAYVYLDPNNLPNELMLQWNDGTWEHRAYWGANIISYGADATAGRRYMGALPVSGQWVRLEVPASQVGLEGRSLNGMAFSLYGGRATFDNAGKVSAGTTNVITNTIPILAINAPPARTNPIVVISDPPTTIPPPVVTNTLPGTNGLPGLSIVDYSTLALPPVGTNALHVLAPSLLELKLINTKQPDPARVTQWDLVDASGNFAAPSPGSFSVTANGQPITVTAVGFKRRPLYAPFEMYDLRIENSMYLQLASPISDNQVIEVKNPGGNLWASSMQFIATASPLRYSPAIHVNQEGYMPNFTKKAMIGYYLGNLGEMNIVASSGFKLVDANTGVQVYQGALAVRGDSGYTYAPTPYQKVYEADFTSFNIPGEYRLVVPGMGGSLPFLIDNGIAMDFARTYQLGLYHQRCGGATAMPYTRFTHDACHVAPASVPMPASSYNFTWTTIANYGVLRNSDNPAQTAPSMSATTQLFPFVRQGTLDTSGGHHDAGDYSKYTCNSANLIHYLMTSVDAFPGVAQLDNMGIPESGDGISDVLQEAKWEADYLAKIQDSDGGFYFLTYPVNREYEGWVTPDHGDPQVVWPKTTSVTAASVAALAECASSPAFKRAYPAVAAQYLQKAQLGWQFLMNAIAQYGKNGAYQKITHYGDVFADQDELAWAACEMYLATGDQSIHQKLLSWFNPADPATWQYGWHHLTECYGHAIRSYAFGARSGKVAASALDATFLSKCETEIVAAGDDTMRWSQMSAYGTSFPDATKRVLAGGWYFSTDQAFDIASAYQVNPKPDYMTAMLANMNYEGGCNPVNVSYVTGLGWKRQKDIVSQWHSVSPATLPPTGIPVGNVTASFFYTSTYGAMPEALTYPSDSAATAPYPFYDRWTDGWNVSAEMVVLNQARSLATLSFIAAQTGLKTQPWRAVQGQITVPTATVGLSTPVTLTLTAPGVDLSSARITWEGRDQDPTFGPIFTFVPKNNGSQWVEAEAQLPDGRRVFAKASFNVNSPNITWANDALPTGATGGGDGGDSWNWVSSNPSPFSGSAAHQSAIAAGSHQHYFAGATATLSIGTGDTLYAYVYLDPANPPSEVELQWNDGTWEHRAYWGANSLGYGIDGTAGRRYMGALPATGQWVQLRVPASQVGLEGSTINGMAFSLFGGRATWDTAGRLSSGG